MTKLNTKNMLWVCYYELVNSLILFFMMMRILIIIIFATSFGVIGWPGLPVETVEAAIDVTVERKYKEVWNNEDVTIDAGDRVELRWKSTNATECYASGPGFTTGGKTDGYDWFIDEPFAGRKSTYTVTCMDATGNSAADSITITTRAVGPPPTATLMAAVYENGKYIKNWSSENINIKNDQQVGLMWMSTNATNCFSNDFNVFSTSGYDWYVTEPTPGTAKTFTIVCYGSGGVAMDSIVVTNGVTGSYDTEIGVDLYSAPDSLDSDPTATLYGKYKGVWSRNDLTIDAGDRVDLRWTSSNADSCSATGPGFSASATDGYDWFIDEPAAGNSSTYTITCMNATGNSAADSITITARAVEPTVILRISVNAGSYQDVTDININPDDYIHFHWDSDDATKCVGDGIVTNNGVNGASRYVFEPTAGNSTTYAITCTGPGGMASDSITVTTNPYPTPTATLYGKYKGVWSRNDLTIDAGDRVDLRWTSSNADSCSATGPGFSASATDGYDWFIDEPAAGNSSTYTITCTGPGGMASDSITITTNNPYPAPEATLKVATYQGSSYIKTWTTKDVDIEGDQQVALRYQGVNTTGCTGTGPGFDVYFNAGLDWYVEEPEPGTSQTYTISCTALGGGIAAEDSITVTNKS